MQPGDKINLDITALAYGGDGIARLNGIVCFIPETIPGENVTAEVTIVKKNFFKAKLLKILSVSNSRIEPVCHYSLNHKLYSEAYCPGCRYMHMDYETEITWKNNQLAELLRKFAGIDKDKMLPPISSPSPYNYRNKLTLHIDRKNKIIGYKSEDNRTVINIEKCCIACDKINDFLIKIRSNILFDREDERLMIRYTEDNGVTVISSDMNTKPMMLKETNSYGEFLVPAASFFQINGSLHDKLLDAFVSLLRQTDTEFLIDLYCGIGIFGIIAAVSGIKQVVGAEIDERALETARANANNRNLDNIKFLAGDAASLFNTVITDATYKNTTLLVDPPRGGLDKRLIEAISVKMPSNIIYISCSPDTLCRDLKILLSYGYVMKSAQLLICSPELLILKQSCFCHYKECIMKYYKAGMTGSLTILML